MTVIADKDRDSVRDLFAREMVDDVELMLFTRPRSRLFVPGRQDCQTCDETRELLEELTGLSDKLRLSTYDVSVDPDAATRFDVSEVPTILLRRAESEPDGSNGAAAGGDTVTDGDGVVGSRDHRAANVRFLGIPAGYEFSTLIADVVDLSKGSTGLSERTTETVRAIDQPVHIQVFVTPT